MIGRCHACPAQHHPLCMALVEIAYVRSGRASVMRRYAKGRLLLDGSRATWFGIIVSGVVKLLHVEPGGRHQIVGLLYAGDHLGPTQPQLTHLIAEAATAVEVCTFPRRMFETLVSRHRTLEPAILAHTQVELDNERSWARVLAHSPAQERVAKFLIVLDRRQRGATSEPRSDILELPLLRGELGSYLGLTIETIGRQLSLLRNSGVIETRGRTIVRVRDWERLQALATPLADSDEGAPR